MYERLKSMREERGLTQEQVAQYLVCNQSNYIKWEQGKADIPIRFLIKLARLYNTSTDYLLDMTDMKYKRKKN